MEGNIIIGCGYVGRALARLLQENGRPVTALLRDPQRGAELEQAGVRVVFGNLDEPDRLPQLPTRGAAVHYHVPPIGGGNIDPRVRIFTASIPQGEEPGVIVYLSTTGVYGDCRGSVVTEETPVNAQTSRAKRRVDAENHLLEWGRERNVPVVILRVSGIYGPGRVPIAQIESGNPIIRQEESPLTNRIHRDDLATVCVAAAERGKAADIFNVSDGTCDSMTSYFNAVADAFGLMRPAQVSREVASRTMNPLLFSYFSESRCIDNSKMLRELGVSLRYRNLEEGLKGCRGVE